MLGNVAASYQLAENCDDQPQAGSLWLRSAAIRRDGVWGFPQRDFDDREALRMSELKNRLGDVFGSRIHGENHQWLAEFLQIWQGGIGFVQNHAVIELLVDPRPHDLFDVGEIHQHAAIVELLAFQHDDGSAVVAVQIAAFSGVIQQAVPVAKVDVLRNLKHDVRS